MKPFEPHVVQRRVQNIIELNFRKINQDEIIEEQANKIRESNAVMIDTLSSIIEYRSAETGQHVRRIGVYTKTLLEDVAANYPEYLLNEHKISLITSASSMHDIGKIAIPDSILNKPGRLTAAEFEIMKTHTVKGCEIMSNLEGMDEDYIQYAYNICRYHHERWDGRGYPDGLQGDGIPICAQVVAIADCYDALTNDHVYKKKLPHDQAVNMILNGECGLFSPKILESLKNVQESFLHYSQQYADRAPREMTSVERAPSVKTASHQDKALDTLQMAQMKYYAMLKYADATVMEVDFATGVYHVVYRSSPDFELLQTGNRFEESIKAFVEGSVYPDDRKKALRVLGDYSEEFFETGMMKRVRQYRVYNHAERTYYWCSTALLRIDTESPAQRKAIIVWNETDPIDAEVRSWSQDEEDMIKNLVGGVQICRADRWFTMPIVNQSLLDLLGYTAEEVKRNFDNRFINIIHPEDRDNTLKAASEQAEQGNQLEFEYRLMAKGGRTMWVLEKTRVMTGEDGQSYYYSIIIDVTQSKKAQDELRLLMERYQTILDETNDIVVEWDAATDRLEFSSNWDRKIDYHPIRYHASDALAHAPHIFPEDLPKMRQLVEDIKAGKKLATLDIRLVDMGGRYHWWRVKVASQLDRDGKVVSAIGIMSDVNAEKQETAALQDRAERDSLTGLFNQRKVRQCIEEYFDERTDEDRCAIMMIDIDDFKSVNDTYGHICGDEVLQAIAHELERVFRSGDIVARVGGDEFLVFMQSVRDEGAIEARAQVLLDALSHKKWKNMEGFHPTCSIGVAFGPEDGESFEVLFHHSDHALYVAKAGGKNRFIAYDKDEMKNFPVPADFSAQARTAIDSENESGMMQETLLDRVFPLMYESKDPSLAVESILEMVGRWYDISRVAVFEEDAAGKGVENTFEWCDEGISPRKEANPYRSYDDMGGDYRSLFDERGIFCCSDVDTLPDWARKILVHRRVKSLLQCIILDNGNYKGFISFDDCAVARIWTKGQIDTLVFISKLLSTFLQKKKSFTDAAEK